MGKKAAKKSARKTSQTKQGPKPRKAKPGIMKRKSYLKSRPAREITITLENGMSQVKVRRMTKIDAMKMNEVLGVDKAYIDEHGEESAAELIYDNLRDIAQVLFPRIILEPDVYDDDTVDLDDDDIRIKDFTETDLETIFDWSSTGGLLEEAPDEAFPKK